MSRSSSRRPPPSGGVVAQPEIFDAVDAAVEAINGAGGIADPAGGPNRPLEVVRCEAGAGGNVEADVALRCAQDSIDEGAIAVLGKYLFGADGTQTWAQAGIPMIGTSPVETEDFINEMVYPLSGGAITGGPGVGIALQQAGAKTIALVTGDVDAGRQLPGLMKPGLASEEDLVQEVYVPLDPSADYTPQLSQLVSANPDAIAVFGSSDINVRVIAGLRSAGYAGLIAVPGTGLTPDGIEVLGDAAEGVLLVSGFEAATGTSDAIAAVQRRDGRHGARCRSHGTRRQRLGVGPPVRRRAQRTRHDRLRLPRRRPEQPACRTRRGAAVHPGRPGQPARASPRVPGDVPGAGDQRR